MAERFKQVAVSNEVSKLVRSNPRSVLHCPEALRFLVGETLDNTLLRRDLKVRVDCFPDDGKMLIN